MDMAGTAVGTVAQTANTVGNKIVEAKDKTVDGIKYGYGMAKDTVGNLAEGTVNKAKEAGEVVSGITNKAVNSMSKGINTIGQKAANTKNKFIGGFKSFTNGAKYLGKSIFKGSKDISEKMSKGALDIKEKVDYGTRDLGNKTKEGAMEIGAKMRNGADNLGVTDKFKAFGQGGKNLFKNILEKSKQTHSALMKAIIDKNQQELENNKDISKDTQKNQEVAFDLMQ